jgi:VIT1/CCC1 family predicted Fe2+/Mn2+ transporter
MFANPAGAIYGAIAVSAMLAAESAQRETYLETVGAVVITLLLYWLAHSYAEYAAERLGSGERLELEELRQTMAHELAMLVGAALPLVPLVFCWLAGVSLATAVGTSVWASAGIIVLIEIAAAIRAKLTGRELASQIVLGAVLGLLVIALKVLLH